MGRAIKNKEDTITSAAEKVGTSPTLSENRVGGRRVALAARPGA